MWEINIAEKTVSFLVSLALGGFFCLFYDLFRAIRKVHNFGFVSVFVQDTLFFCLSAVITFCFLLSLTQGMIRGYFIFGIAVGFLTVFFSLSPFILKSLTWALRTIITILRKVRNFCEEKLSKIRKFLKIKGKKD